MPTASEIAKHLDGEVLGDGNAVLKSFAPPTARKPGDLTFAENEDFFARAEQSAATAIIADKRFSSSKKILIRVPNARIAFAKALALFFPEPKFSAGIHPTAVIAVVAQKLIRPRTSARIASSANACRSARARVLQGGNSVGDDSKLGEDMNLFPNVTIYPRTQIGERVRIHANSRHRLGRFRLRFGRRLSPQSSADRQRHHRRRRGDRRERDRLTAARSARPSSARARRLITSCRSRTTWKSASIACSSRRSASRAVRNWEITSCSPGRSASPAI